MSSKGQVVKISSGSQKLLYFCGTTSELAIDEGRVFYLHFGYFRMRSKVTLHAQTITQ